MNKTYPEPAPFNDEAEYTDIPMMLVESKQVACIGYDATTKTMAVQFTRGPGHIYHYPDVTPETHAAFVGAESIGTYFGKHIKPLRFKKFPAPAGDRLQEPEAAP